MRRFFWKSRSLYSILMFSFAFCSFLLLAFIVLTLLPSSSTLLMQNAIDRTRETVLQSAGSIDIYVNGLLGTLNYTAEDITDSLNRNDSQWENQVDYFKESSSDITDMAVFTAGGALLYSTNGKMSQSGTVITSQEWFQKALLWQGASTYFSSPHVQHLFGSQRNYVITLSRAFYYYDRNNKQKTGVILMDVRYSAFEKLIKATRLSASGYLYVLDEKNNIILHPKMQMIYSGLYQEDTVQAADLILGVTKDTAVNREQSLIVVTLANSRWRLVGVAYCNEIFSMQRDFSRTMIVILICAALFSIIPTTLIAHYVTTPILHLEHKMQKVEAGDLSVSIGERSFTEIRSVSVAFNHMLARIRALMDQVVQEQEKKRLYELNALQSQINPHFLYNTLDSIIWMEERGKSREAITMVSALAKLFRISISKGRPIITVTEELEHVRNYLIIQKMRFKEKFTYEIQMEEEAANENTVKLILQPLVENSISHGLDYAIPKELHIYISAAIDGENLLFCVKDDGVGIPKEKAERLLSYPAGKSGIGLKNVHERIQLICGSQYGLTIQSEEGQGTTVYIRLPRHMEVPE